MQAKNGILVVSFGTSYADTRRRTLTAIETRVQACYPNLPVYSAWTSKMIIKKIEKNTGEKILTVTEALTLMAQDGITDVSIQPTHVINGIENDCMKEDANQLRHLFHSMQFGGFLYRRHAHTDTNDCRYLPGSKKRGRPHPDGTWKRTPFQYRLCCLGLYV